MAKNQSTRKTRNSPAKNSPLKDVRYPLAQQPKPPPTPQPAAPAPAAPKPPMPTATYDSLYTAGIAGLDLDYNNTLADITQAQGRYSFDTGYGADGAVDPRNPYSQASLLQKMWRENRSGTSIGYASRGQLYSGARKGALSSVDYEYQRNDSGLKEQARRAYEDLTIAQQRAGAARNVGEQQLRAEQGQRWQDATNEWWRQYG